MMEKNAVDAYMIPISDWHQSEYVGDYFKCVRWISGFTGSAGTVAVTREDAGLWTDGRYYVQAEEQLRGSGIRLFRASDQDVPNVVDWLKGVLEAGDTVGFDESVFSIQAVRRMKEAFEEKGIAAKAQPDFMKELWQDRPALPQSPIFLHSVEFAGRSRMEKIREVRAWMQKKGARYFLLTSLEDIAWLFNIRGADIPNIPVVIANAVLSLKQCRLFVDPSKVSPDVRSQLEADGIRIKEYGETRTFLRALEKGDSVLLDPQKVNALLYRSIPSDVSKVECVNETALLKAVKNEVEIKNLRQCQLTDGIAMVKFIKWLKTSLHGKKITEVSAGEKLNEFRRQNVLCIGPSFIPIVAYKDHAAMMHYRASPQTDYTLKEEGLLLVDSGGQYFNGTTDITRTLALGKLTREEKEDYTLVLKSNIALSVAKFLYGTTGSNIDILARQVMWSRGLDYKCGTGHGVGYFLSVHEGPHRIARTPDSVKIEDGMVVTNEPGIYREGRHGVRIENMMLAVNDGKTEYGQFVKFEILSYCPIDTDAVVAEMLTSDELEWINRYNHDVFVKLSPYLQEDERTWLAGETAKISGNSGGS